MQDNDIVIGKESKPVIKYTDVPTFEVKLYIGLKEGYKGEHTPYEIWFCIISSYVDRVGLCVSVKKTQYIYTNGCEDGLEIGFINYPRFPSNPTTIISHAFNLAHELLLGCNQMNVTVVAPGQTTMLSNIEEIKKYEESKYAS